ncbi:MAG: hypothetical protein QF860_03875 [Planctomycetota bacterium]|jgi:hypothetical protein|nr:hypothetical protein [Planctomycetota bacterium]
MRAAATRIVAPWIALCAVAPASAAPQLGTAHPLSSYAMAAVDDPGSVTGATESALGVPDYDFTNDQGLGFGAGAEAFDVGEATVLILSRPARDVAGQDDLVISAFVGGLGATDSALVEVSVSTDGVLFHTVGSFDTASGRTNYPHPHEEDFAGVKHFTVDLGGHDMTTHVRLANTAGSPEGLRLDSLEALHPHVPSSRAFELRLERYRGKNVLRFLVRIKNIAAPGGAGIHELRIDKPPPPADTNLQETWTRLYDQAGTAAFDNVRPLFLCVEGCIRDNGPDTLFSRHVWSEDGVRETPTGLGLPPGHQAAHKRYRNFDLDVPNSGYLSGFSFTVSFTDGTTHQFDFDGDVVGQASAGRLYQKYQYFDSTPAISGPLRTRTYEFIGP